MKYVPILKGKEGEYGALETLGVHERNAIVPVIEIPQVPYDHSKDENAKEIDEHVVGISARIAKCWRDRPAMIDMRLCENERLRTGEHPLSAVLNACRQQGLDVRPVVTTFSCEAYLEAASQCLTRTDTGGCIRLVPDNFDEERDLHGDLDQLLSTIGLAPGDVDLLIDFGFLRPGERGTNLTITRARLAAIPQPVSWRALIVAGTSFPPDLSDVDAQTMERLPRGEWEVWESLQRRPNLLPRADLVFSDFGISHPSPPELDPRLMRMSASIRYTTDTAWLVAKGRNVRQYGFEQYFDLCRNLIAEPEYCGRDYSWGDQFIWGCAHDSVGPGNATTWRKVGTSHHLTLVAKQTANVA